MPYSGTREEQLAKKAEYNRQHYVKNKQYYIDKTKRHRQRLFNWFAEYKSTLKCAKCSENHPACLDFHHENPNTKELTVSEMVAKELSKKRIIEEINKCTVLCSNCHRKLHYEERIK
jgi:hypothetical protein